MANKTTPQDIPMEVVHQTPGRVRLKACSKNIDIPTLKAIAKQLQQHEGIYEVKLNNCTGSMVASFDVSTMPLSHLWEILESLNINSQSPTLTSPTTEVVENKSPGTINTAVTVGADLIDSLVPMIACMLVNQKLRIFGWRSLPISLMTSKLTRGIMKQLKVQLEELTTDKNLTPTVAPSFQVLHSTLGRVRLRVPQVGNDVDYAQRLEQLILSTDGVTNVRINSSATSVAIAHEPHLDMLPYLAKLVEEANLTTSESSQSTQVA
ncbi:HMA2 domain-containing protein [Dapis sp. BLCC M126]|uniref:HMA2 domain-containing protein n=1 Tax=Dapis sp. BLCC M126 TaxID=3400189 RepID=UPI003CF1E9AB